VARYPEGSSEYTAHGEGLAKGYNLSRNDVRAKRARRGYERTADPNRRAVRDDLDALDRAREQERAAEEAELFRLVHHALRAATRRDGKPPRNLVLTFRGRIFTSRDPQALPRNVVARALGGKIKVRRKRR